MYFDLLTLQISGKPRSSGKVFSDQIFHYCDVLLYFEIQTPSYYVFLLAYGLLGKKLKGAVH